MSRNGVALVRNNSQQQLTSRVWNHFELQPPSVAGGACKAVCNNCGQMMSYDPRHGTTTHLLRHIERSICSKRAAALQRRRLEQEVVATTATNGSSTFSLFFLYSLYSLHLRFQNS